VEQPLIGDTIGYPFQRRAGDDLDGIVALGAVGLEEGLAIFLCACGLTQQYKKEEGLPKQSHA